MRLWLFWATSLVYFQENCILSLIDKKKNHCGNTFAWSSLRVLHNDKTTQRLYIIYIILISFDSHVFFFLRWLDKLGLAARLYHSVIVRQTFVRGDYSLLDKDLNPNPVGVLKQKE